MKIRIVSDLHLEINDGFALPRMEGEKDMVLILAGDICTIFGIRNFAEFFADACVRHRRVLYVFGNHEFYKGKMGLAEQNFYEAVAKHNLNLTFTSIGTAVIIDDIKFIMATLWTDWNHPQNILHTSNEFSMKYCQRSMGDFFIIKDADGHTLTPEKTKVLHAEQLTFIEKELKRKETEKVVVITHHAPSLRSIHGRFWKDPLNPAFTSNLRKIWEEYKPNLLIHGHTHDGFDYMENDFTRLICNPKGYGMENPQFNPKKVVEI